MQLEGSVGGERCHGANIVPVGFCGDGDKGTSWTYRFRPTQQLWTVINKVLQTLTLAECAADEISEFKFKSVIVHFRKVPGRVLSQASPTTLIIWIRCNILQGRL